MAPPDSALGTWLGPVSAFGAVPSGNLFWLSLSVLGSYALGDALFFRSTHALGVPGALAGWLLRSGRRRPGRGGQPASSWRSPRRCCGH